MTATATATRHQPPPDAIPPGALKFNLSLAMASEPVITRSGEPVQRLRIEQRRDTAYPVLATIAGKERSFTVFGTYWINRPDPFDLFMAAQ